MKKTIVASTAALLAIVLLLFGTYRLMNLRTFQLFGGLTNQVSTSSNVVALTFDDGPTNHTEQLLPILDKYNVKATFFLVGNELEKNPEQGRKIAQAGHQIGNHTYSHNRMVLKSPSYIRNEIEKTNALIRQTGYEGNIDFRPPYGKKLVGLPYYLMKQHMNTITWSIEPDTYYASPSDKVKDVMSHVKPGSIILMHPMYDDTGDELKAIEGTIQALLNKGYTLVTVQQLLKSTSGAE